MSWGLRLAALLAVAALGAGFAKANAGRRATIDLGLVTLHDVPVTFVAFGGVVAGMAAMLAAGMAADLKTRRLLQAARDDARARRGLPDDEGGPRLE